MGQLGDYAAAREIMKKTEQWAIDYADLSRQRVAGEVGDFFPNGALSLPAEIARPSLRITPQVYRRERHSPIPYTAGYIAIQPEGEKVFTMNGDNAQYKDVPLLVNPTPLTFAEYRDRTSETKPLWLTTPEKLVGKWNSYKGMRFAEPGTNPPVTVYRALGVLPDWSSLASNTFTYDLRIDPLLHDADGKITDSCRMYNYTNTTENDSGNAMHQFAPPFYVAGTQRHVAPYEVKQPEFYGPDGEIRGWKMPPKEFSYALFLAEHQTGVKGEEAFLVVHLAGASALAGASEQV